MDTAGQERHQNSARKALYQIRRQQQEKFDRREDLVAMVHRRALHSE